MQTKHVAEFLGQITEDEFEALEKSEIREIVQVLCTQEPPFEIFGNIFNSAIDFAVWMQASLS